MRSLLTVTHRPPEATTARGPGRLAALALAAVALLTGLLVNPVSVVPAQASTLEAAMTADINAARAAHGLPALRVAADLVRVARSHSAAMAGARMLYHTPNLTAAICCWLAVGENVGEGGSVAAVNAAFLASAPHRANILNSRYTQVGVGIVVDSAGTLWVTEDFRRPSSSAPAGQASPSSATAATSTSGRAGQSVSRSATRAPVGIVALHAQVSPGYRDPLRAAEEFCRVMAAAART